MKISVKIEGKQARVLQAIAAVRRSSLGGAVSRAVAGEYERLSGDERAAVDALLRSWGVTP